MNDPARPRSGRGGTAHDRQRPEETRRRILDATAAILAGDGFARARLSDIAARAGVQAPAIYYYFDSRKHLVEEVVITGMVRHLGHVRDRLESLPPGTAALDRIDLAVEAHLQVILQESDYAAAAIRNTSQLPVDSRERQLVEERRYAAIWRDLLDCARAEGAMHPDLDPGASRMLVLGALNWACEWWSPHHGDLSGIVRTAQLLVRNGLSRPPGTKDT
ncbi:MULTISPECIES: TetR/AcrR family transcriptional regulator [unclassified Pseudonocardia]|uniref:TetR/AcrR family transcriptional regulator n=1 Tax=unclassified Pseudonocardia TaxID=2619320 RepID=UPI0001FFDE00|nr:TetR/AcrR family transcriptional regulator [Pseudonocardia sp. Ae707_Ps1]OLM16764.1 Transcriptional regulator, TetR family [Pseudonocardia sp. Ae707_Ps1]